MCTSLPSNLFHLCFVLLLIQQSSMGLGKSVEYISEKRSFPSSLSGQHDGVSIAALEQLETPSPKFKLQNPNLKLPVRQNSNLKLVRSWQSQWKENTLDILNCGTVLHSNGDGVYAFLLPNLTCDLSNSRLFAVSVQDLLRVDSLLQGNAQCDIWWYLMMVDDIWWCLWWEKELWLKPAA